MMTFSKIQKLGSHILQWKNLECKYAHVASIYSWLPYKFNRAAITKYHKLGGLELKKFLVLQF